MVSDFIPQFIFKEMPLIGFSNNIKDEYPKISENGHQIVLPPPTTSLGEAEFSSYTSMKASL